MTVIGEDVLLGGTGVDISHLAAAAAADWQLDRSTLFMEQKVLLLSVKRDETVKFKRDSKCSWRPVEAERNFLGYNNFNKG